MKKATLIALILVSFNSAQTVWANSLESTTTAGSTALNETLQYDFGEKPEASQGKWEGSLGYSLSRTSQVDAATQQTITDKSHTFDGALGYKNNWELGGGITYGITPDENLKNMGPNIYLGYTYRMGEEVKSKENTKEEDEDIEEPFQPSLGLKLKLAKITYTETFSAALPRRPGKPPLKVSGSEEIAQTSGELTFSFDPWAWLGLELSTTHYQYDKDVAQFLSFLDSPLALRMGANSMSDSISGFQIRLVSFSLTEHPTSDLELSQELTQSTSATDGTSSLSEKIMISLDLNDNWTLGIGAEHGISSGVVSNSGIFTAKINFD